MLVAFFHIRVYITHTLASVLASKTSPRGTHDKQLVVVTVFCYTDVIGFSAAPEDRPQGDKTNFGHLNSPVGCRIGAGGFFVYPNVFHY